MNEATSSVPRRTVAKGVAWTAPVIAIAASAPSLAASTAGACGGGLRESSGGGDVRVLGALTTSNTGGAEWTSTLQTKPLYDCAGNQPPHGTVTSCEDASAPTSGPVSIAFQLNNAEFELSPQSLWILGEDWVDPKWTVESVVDNGTTTITFSYPSIARYQSSGQIQVPLKRQPGATGTILSATTSGCVFNEGVWNTVPVG